MPFKQSLIKFHWILSSQFGLDFLRFVMAFREIPKYLSDWISFRRVYGGRMGFVPCLHDRGEEGGATKNEYFWQDLLVARFIFEANPVKHVDVGSRVDGLVAHVASYRECEVLDVRPITTQVPGVVFRQADLMGPLLLAGQVAEERYCDSLSCLHAIEHFGLGRYGDPISPLGYHQGISNMSRLLSAGGTFYLSAPIGQERVEFNANWVFDPRSILRCALESGLALQKLILISANSGPVEFPADAQTLAKLAQERYQLGLFIFMKER